MTKYVYDERTAPSAAICTFEDGVDGIPTKSLVVTIPPTLSGASSVSEKQTGRNLFDNTGLFPVSGSVSSYYFKQFDYNSNLIPQIKLKAGITYTFSLDVTSTIEPFNFSVGCGNGVYSSDILTVYNKSSGRISITFTPTTAQLNNGDIFAFRCPRYQAQNSFDYSISNVQLEYGSTAHAYEQYQTPTVYTASLGRTIYGGEVDIVNGTGTDENGNDFTFDGQEINTRLGYNAFWSDSGDTEVTYYIQIPVEEKYIINGETLSDIADAIREKKQTSNPILTEDMADEISSIEMGGSDLLDLASQSTFDFTDDTYKTSALTIPDRMFNNNQRIRTVNISGIKTVESYAFIQCKATSLSFPDVETIGYQAFFQCRGASDVPLSIPNVVTIGEEAFKEAYVCGESPSYRFLDISKCVTIGNNAFRSTRINGFKMDSVETLGNMPWYGSWFSMTTVVFPKLKTAHDQMCRGMNFTNLVIGPDWQSCGGGFAGYDMDWRNKYVYVYAITPPTMGGDFSLWKPPVAFYVPADSVDAYKAAPYWSQYASIILPLPSDHLTIDTWL